MDKAILGLCISIAVNGIMALRNFFGKKIQIILSAVASAVWLLEYIFIFPSATYIIITSFTLIYLVAYNFRKPLLRFFKMDLMFYLMILFIVIAGILVAVTYEGIVSIFGVIIVFLEVFSTYLFTAQGIRFKNIFVYILYIVLDCSIENYLVITLDIINMVVPVITIIKNRGEKISDREGLKEYAELIKISKEIHRLRLEKRMQEKKQSADSKK